MDKYTDDIVLELKGKTKVFPLQGLRFYECPLSYFDSADIMGLLRLVYLSDATGVMPFAGGLVDQPAFFVEALDVYNAEKHKVSKDD